MVSNEKLMEALGKKPIGVIKIDSTIPFEKKHDSSYEEQVFNQFKQTHNSVPQDNIKSIDGGYEAQLISGFKNKFSSENKEQKLSDVKIGANSLNSVGNKLNGIPPLLLIGIVVMIVPFFVSGFGWLQTLGFVMIIIAMFDKILSAEKKAILKEKLKAMFKKK